MGGCHKLYASGCRMFGTSVDTQTETAFIYSADCQHDTDLLCAVPFVSSCFR